MGLEDDPFPVGFCPRTYLDLGLSSVMAAEELVLREKYGSWGGGQFLPNCFMKMRFEHVVWS